MPEDSAGAPRSYNHSGKGDISHIFGAFKLQEANQFTASCRFNPRLGQLHKQSLGLQLNLSDVYWTGSIPSHLEGGNIPLQGEPHALDVNIREKVYSLEEDAENHQVRFSLAPQCLIPCLYIRAYAAA
jgi:hypothetical protein